MHFVVTGGAGFIGSHVTEQLLSEGHHVTAIDNFTTGSRQNLPEQPNLRLLQKDIFDCRPQDFNQSIDGIAHLAATPSVTESWLNPLAIHHNNLSAMINVIQLCHALKIPRLVFASSAAVYGEQTTLPIREDQDKCPTSPYGLQKLMSEQYASLFAQQLGFSFIGLRLFNVFGPRQSFQSPYSGVISIFATAMQQDCSITIYGDGRQTRDYIYVKDIAIAFSKSLTTSLPSGTSLICNIGSGKSISLIHLIEILKNYFPNWKSTVKFAPYRPGDLQHSQADISKALSILNFTPSWSLESGLSMLTQKLYDSKKI